MGIIAFPAAAVRGIKFFLIIARVLPLGLSLLVFLHGPYGTLVIFLYRALARRPLRGALALLRILRLRLWRLLVPGLFEPLVGPIFLYIVTGVTALVLAGPVSAK